MVRTKVGKWYIRITYKRFYIFYLWIGPYPMTHTFIIEGAVLSKRFHTLEI